MSGHDHIVEQLKAGLQMIEQARVPPELQGIAYRHTLQVLAAQNGGQDNELASNSTQTNTGSPRLAAISTKLEIDIDVVAHVFEEKNEQVHLILTKTKLPNPESKAASMRDVALLVAAGRQAAGIEDYTSAALIRHECDELGVLDSANFSTELARVEMRTRGGPKSREVHASRHQFEQAATLMIQISSGGEK